tara:strand:- start:554 stop:1243 length:690 start_codon:yes stop_codon:yes gene_type:complete
MPKIKAMNPRGYDCVNVLMQKAVKKVLVKARKRKQAIDWSKNNRDRRNQTNKDYQQRNLAKVRKMSEDWRQANRDHVNKKENERNKRKVEDSDMEFILKKRMRARVQMFMKQHVGLRKANSTFTMIGIDKTKFVTYLTNQLLDGETLKECDIDHIFPLTSYDLSSGVIDARSMHYSNMQPLSQFENASKLNKLPTKAMAAKVDRSCWPDGVTEDMLPDIYPGWATPLRM